MIVYSHLHVYVPVLNINSPCISVCTDSVLTSSVFGVPTSSLIGVLSSVLTVPRTAPHGGGPSDGKIIVCTSMYYVARCVTIPGAILNTLFICVHSSKASVPMKMALLSVLAIP